MVFIVGLSLRSVQSEFNVQEGESQHSFMAKRIMLHFPLLSIYPLAILFEEAIIVGAENDTQLFPGEKGELYCTSFSA
jgi:hypothetical protein